MHQLGIKKNKHIPDVGWKLWIEDGEDVQENEVFKVGRQLLSVTQLAEEYTQQAGVHNTDVHPKNVNR